MEIIESILSTNQSDELKEYTTNTLMMKTVSQPMTGHESRKILLRLTEWIISSEHKFLRETALKGFDALVNSCFSVFLELVDINYFNNIFTNMIHTKSVNLIDLVITIFSKLHKSSISQSVIPLYSAVRPALVLYLGHHGNNQSFLQSLAHLYTMFPELLPTFTQEVIQLGNVVVQLHSSHPPQCKCTTKLNELLTHVWAINPEPSLFTLQMLYSLLSDPDISCPPACLSTVLEVFSANILSQTVKTFLDEPQERLLLVLTRLFGWLEDRPSPELAGHMINLLEVLGKSRAWIVLQVSKIWLVRLVELATHGNMSCRDQIVMMVLLMLYGDQHSPAAFLCLAPHLPIVLELLATESKWQCRDLGLEAAQYFTDMFPGVVAGSQLEIVLQEENLPQLTEDKRQQIVGMTWNYPGKIVLDRMPGQVVGLVNLGDTCYMNSVLQSLYSTNMFLSQVAATRTCQAQPVLLSLQRVFRCLKLCRRSFASPWQFLSVSRPPWFDPGEQQDCSEFLNYLLHTLEEEIGMVVDEKKPTIDMIVENGDGTNDEKNIDFHIDTNSINDLSNVNSSLDSGVDSGGDVGPCPSLVQAVFGGKFNTAYQCLECGNTSLSASSFTELLLPISCTRPAQATVPDLAHLPGISIARARHQLGLPELIRNYLAPEDLAGDNQYQCDVCEGLRDAVKTTQIEAAPKHLIIALLRFKYDHITRRRVKVCTPVECPASILLPTLCGEEVRYQLYSVVVHSGQSSDGGHYYTWVRGRQIEEEWHRVSDMDVETVPGQWNQKIHSRRETPYLLFYCREGLL